MSVHADRMIYRGKHADRMIYREKKTEIGTKKILREILYQVYRMLANRKFVSKVHIIYLAKLLAARAIHGKTTENQFSALFENIFKNTLTTLRYQLYIIYLLGHAIATRLPGRWC